MVIVQGWYLGEGIHKHIYITQLDSNENHL